MLLRPFRKKARQGAVISRTVRMMKCLSAILLACCLQVSAKTHSQEISLSLDKAGLETIFKEIQKQTDYRFVYTKEQLEGAAKVTIHVKNENLETVLQLCFQNQSLTYAVEDRHIIIQIKEKLPGNSHPQPQWTDVSGRVINEKGEPVAGATISVKGTSKATSTNENGEFTLEVPGPDMVLVISAVNIETVEVRLNAKTRLTISVRTAVKPLDEIIAKGYYTTTQRLNTGTVSKVTAEQISREPVSNPLATLAARVPGLFITQGNGLPGSNFSVLIRGRNSIQNGTAPLFVVDGIPFLSSNDKLSQRINLNANSPFNTISPEDIESIEVLKDADATAIYGSRGANGVILITTKKAKLSRSSVDLNIYTGWGKVTRTSEFMNTAQYLEMRREAFANDGIVPDVSNAPDLLLWNAARDINWKDVLIGGTAKSFNSNLRYSGGNENTKFTLGTNYYSETTVFPGDFGNKRYTIDLSVRNQFPNKKINTTINFGFGSDIGKFPQDNLGQYLNLPPHAMSLYDSLGRISWTEGAQYFLNPLAKINATSKGTTDRLSVNTIVNWNINSEFHFGITGGFNKITFDEVSLTPISSQNPLTNPTGRANFGNASVRNWAVEPQIDYKRKVFAKGIIQALVGASQQESIAQNSLITGSNYTNDALIQSTAGAGSLTATNSKSVYKYHAFFGRIGFNWDEKYLLNLTGRRDGSSRFGPAKRYANFGAMGFGWVFGKEKIITQNLSFISFGKIRGSYGVAGNDQILNYQFLDTWSGTQYPYQSIPGFRPTRLFNPNYSWEQIRKIELAIELGLFRDRILINMNWFRNRSDNQIIQYNLPDQTGFNGILRNFPGVVQNKGYEIQLNSKNVNSKNFEWSTGFNITFSKNKLIEFPGLSTTSYSSTYMIGKPLNIYIGYHSLGVNPQSGLYEFEDISKNGQIDYDNQDYTYNGTTDPKYYGGVQNYFRYKNFEFDFLLEFRKQRGLNPILSSGLMIGTMINQPVNALNRWQKPGDRSTYQKFSQDFNSQTYTATYFQSLSGALLTDASYIRCKNLSFSYNVSSSFLKKMKINSCKIYLQAQNLFVITNYVGADPENQSVVGLPPLRMIITGIKLSL